VLSLCCSPLAEGLFHKGIVQSAYSLPDVPHKQAQQTGPIKVSSIGLGSTASPLMATGPSASGRSSGQKLSAARRWPKDCFIRASCKVPTACRMCRTSRRSKPACRVWVAPHRR
jgi:carboxylesterase type B